MANFANVSNFLELKIAILDPDITTIFLISDIIGLVGGVIIPSSKTSLTIDGKDPKTGINHTFTDYNSYLFSDAITMTQATGATIITLKNLDITCRNYYGVVAITDTSSTANVSIVFDNVIFNGAQLSYNRRGTTIIRDSAITIATQPLSLSSAQEVSETNRLHLAGKVDIDHQATSDSCFWIAYANGEFIVEDDAEVNINIKNRELIYSDYSVKMSFGNNCKFTLTTNHGMFYSTGVHMAKSFTVGDNASIYIKQLTRNNNVPTIRLENGMVLGNNITFKVFVTHTSADPLIYCASNSILNFTNSQRVILYNYTGKIFDWGTGSGTISINTEVVNYWTAAKTLDIAGNIDDNPLYIFRKNDNSNLTISTSIVSNATSATTSNFVVGVDGNTAPAKDTFDTTKARMITFGKLPLLVSEINDSSLIVEGNTTSSSIVRYKNSDVTFDMLANDMGDFSHTLIISPIKRSTATIRSNFDFLNAEIQFAIPGSLKFLSVPTKMLFKPKITPTPDGVILRQLKDWQMSVIDTRVNGSTWYLLVKIAYPLTNDIVSIEDAVVFQDEDKTIINEMNDTVVFTGNGNVDESTTSIIKWDDISGVLLELEPFKNYLSGKYHTLLYWSLISE